MTPYKAWTGMKLNLNYLKIFSCNAYAHIPKHESGKIDLKTKSCIFLGYSETAKGYQLYEEKKEKVFFSRDVVFDQMRNKNMSSPEKKEAAPKLAININLHSDIPDDEDDADDEVNADDVHDKDDKLSLHNPQRPKREIKVPDLYIDQVAYIANQNDNQKSLREALSSEDKAKWTEAIEKECNSIHKNNIWYIVNLPKCQKAVGSKWLFKRK